LKESQTLCELSDAAYDWREKYIESGVMSEDDNELYQFLSEMIKLGTSIDVRSLSKEFSGVFEDAKQRGFLDFLGIDSKTGEYVMICPNRKCARKRRESSPTYPKHPDQRGKHININEDGSQDKYEKVFIPKEIKLGEKTCPSCGDVTMSKDHVDPDTGEDVYTCSRCGDDYITNDKGGYNRFYF
jgi:ribosomal protein S27AE